MCMFVVDYRVSAWYDWSMDKTLHYNLIFRPEPEGGFTVTVPSLPGCITYGRDLREAKKMAYDAIAGYIQSLKKHGEPIPSDVNDFVTTIDVEVKSRSKKLVYA